MSVHAHPLARRFSSHAAQAIRTVALAAAVTSVSGIALAQTVGADKSPMFTKPAAASAANVNRAVRASMVIGMDVQGAAGKSVGKIKDLIVNLNNADVRYAVLEFDPGFFQSPMLFAVPLSALSYVAEGKPLLYKEVTRAQLDRAAVDKADWQKALDNSRYVSALDQNYGYKPPGGEARSMRASSLIGKDVDNRSGKSIGEIQELVLDMGAGKVQYAVLAFDPSWFTLEKMFAFPLTAFTTVRDRDDLMLDVDRSTLQSMKNFDATNWGRLNDLNRDEFVNQPTSKR